MQVNSSTKILPPIWLAAAGTLLYAIARLFIGQDFADEPFYAATAWRFALGEKPYLSDISQTQGAAVLIAPLLWIFSRFSPQLDGVLLYLRCLYFLAQLLFCWLTFKALPIRLGLNQRVLLALFAIAFTPIMSTFSHNTLVLLSLWGMVICYYLQPRAKRWSAAIEPLLLGSVSTIFPPLSIIALAFLFFRGKGELSTFRSLARDICLFLLPLALQCFLFRITPIDMVRAYLEFLPNEKTHAEFFLAGRAKTIASAFLKSVTHPTFLFFTAFFAHRIYLRRSIPSATFFITALLAIAFANRPEWGGHDVFGLHWQVAIWGALFCLSPSAPTRKPLATTRSTVKLAWLLLGSGIVYTWFGGGHLRGAYFTWMPLILLVGAELAPSEENRKAHRGSLVFLCCFLLILNYGSRGTWRNGRFTDHRTTLHTGPYAGIYTSPTRANYLSEIQTAVRAEILPGEAILSHPHFVIGYLFGHHVPIGRHTWDLCFSDPIGQCGNTLNHARQDFLWLKIKYEVHEFPRLHWREVKVGEREEEILNRRCRPLTESVNFSLWRCRFAE